jgi:hypothetical protein
MVRTAPLSVLALKVIGLTAVAVILFSSRFVVGIQISYGQFNAQLQEQQAPPATTPLAPQDQSSDNAVTIVSDRLTTMPNTTTTQIIGEVRNDSPNTISRIQVDGKLYDSSGQLIDLGHSSLYALDVRPGEKRPFVLTFSTEGVASYTLDTEVSPGPAQEKPAALEVGVSRHGIVEKNTVAGTHYEVVGNVTNVGNSPATFVSVIATFYDAAGKIVDFESGLTLPSTIPPGESGDFIIDAIIGPGGNYTAEAQKIASVNVTADSSEYSSIIEP